MFCSSSVLRHRRWPRLLPSVPGQDSATPAAARSWRGADAVVSVDPPPRNAIASRNSELFRRGYVLVMFNNNDCAEDTTLRNADGSWAFRNTRFYPAYPGYDWGILAGWAWGASRIADYLETDPAIDKTKLIITGASRAGKAAMVAAAFDERLMGAPVVTGGGGIGAYRFSGIGRGGKEGLGEMMNKYPNWFSPNLHEFWGQTDKLPFDCRTGSSHSVRRAPSSRSKAIPIPCRSPTLSSRRSSRPNLPMNSWACRIAWA